MKFFLNVINSGILVVGASLASIINVCNSNTSTNNFKTTFTALTQEYNIFENGISPHFDEWLNPENGYSWNNAFSKENVFSPTGDIMPNANSQGGVLLNTKNTKTFNDKAKTLSNQNHLIGAVNEKSYSELSKNTKTQKYDYTVNDLTPTTGGVFSQIDNSNSLAFIKNYLNAELNYWYYKTFANELSQSVGDYNLRMQKYSVIHNKILVPFFNNILDFDFGGSYNFKQKELLPDDNYGELTSTMGAFVTDAVLTALDAIPDFGPFISSLVGLAIGHWMKPVDHFRSVEYYYRFSKTMGLTTIDNIFSDILKGSKGIINNFVKNNDVHPDHLEITDFDFSVKKFDAYTDGSSGSWINHVLFKQNSVTIKPNIKLVFNASKLPNNYDSEMAILDNPYRYGIARPMPYKLPNNTNEIKWNDWENLNYKVNGNLIMFWSRAGAIPPDMQNTDDVKFVPVNLVKGQIVKIAMEIQKLGFTTQKPRYFYLKVS